MPAQNFGRYQPNANTKLLLRFDNNCNDSSGNGNNGTPTNITYSNGLMSLAANFNGSSSIVIFILDSLIFNFTYSAWIYKTADGSIHTIKSGQAIDYGNQEAIQFCINATGYLQLVKSQTIVIGTSNSTIPNNVWVHVGVTYNSSGVFTFYKNGAEIGTGTNFQTCIPRLAYVGCSEGSGVLTEYFNGAIEEFIIENIVWSKSIFAKYYNYAKGFFGIT